MAVTDYSTTAGNNSTISGVNIAEGCSPAGINNAIRQMMADVRAFYDATPLIAGTPTISGNWTVSGAWTITGNMTFNDNVKAIFGTGSDLRIYHDGSNSFVEDAGTGNLSLKGSIVQITGTSDEVLVRGTAGGAAELRHNGSTKLKTSTTGVTVTGLVGGDTIGGAMVSTDVSADTGSTTKVPHVAAVETYVSGRQGMRFIASLDASSSATLDFTGFDHSRYDAYLFVLQNVVPATDGVDLNMRLSVDGGSNYLAGTEYQWAGTNNSSTSSQSASGAAAWELNVNVTIGNDAGIGMSGEVWLHQPGNASGFTTARWNVGFGNTSATILNAQASGICGASAAAHNAARFLASSGNLASGTITMYGLRNS